LRTHFVARVLAALIQTWDKGAPSEVYVIYIDWTLRELKSHLCTRGIMIHSYNGVEEKLLEYPSSKIRWNAITTLKLEHHIKYDQGCA
jgi:hypothetical protein